MLAQLRSVIRKGKRRVLFFAGLIPIALVTALPTYRRSAQMNPDRMRHDIEAAAVISTKDPVVIHLAELARSHATNAMELAQAATTYARYAICYDWDENVWGYDRVGSYQELRAIANKHSWPAAHGDCDDIASLVIAVTRLCGISTDLRLRSGILTGHAWVELVVDGRRYSFNSTPRAGNELAEPSEALRRAIFDDYVREKWGNWRDREASERGIRGTRAWAIATTPAVIGLLCVSALWLVICATIEQRVVDRVPDWACKYEIPMPWRRASTVGR